MGDETHVSENTKPPSTPYLGRTVRVVGPVEPVDPATLPQQMAVAGKLGKSLGDWYSGTTPCPDPLVRVLAHIPHLAQTSDAVNRQLSCFSSRYMNLLAVFQI